MTKALITGGAGFIGKHLERQLRDAGWDVAIMDPKSGSGSILDLPALNSAMKGVDVVFHMAAIAHLWVQDVKLYERVNVQGTQNILDAARAHGVKRIIATQSEVILRGWNDPGTTPLTEGEPTPAIEAMAGPYSHSKHRADQMCRNAEDLDIVSLYPTVPVGAEDDAMTAPTAMLDMFLFNPPPAYLPTALNFVAVEDVARAHVLAAEKAEKGARYLISGEDWTMERIFDFLARHSEKRMPRSKIPYVLARISASLSEAVATITKAPPMATVEGVRFAKYAWDMSSEKATHDLGWRAGAIEPALESAVHWLKTRRKPHQ
ncbi:MAG: NAD-dependent epimerase/dehydratase family protein [Sphingomonadales bacterium]|jgi:dihydroflavonol-4-reductase